MVFTGYDRTEGAERPNKWRVENSWGASFSGPLPWTRPSRARALWFTPTPLRVAFNARQAPTAATRAFT